MPFKRNLILNFLVNEEGCAKLECASPHPYCYEVQCYDEAGVCEATGSCPNIDNFWSKHTDLTCGYGAQDGPKACEWALNISVYFLKHDALKYGCDNIELRIIHPFVSFNRFISTI